jgi:hypothetical protein
MRAPANSGVALRALMLLGRWTRVAQGHIAQGASCMCAGGLATVQAADLEQQVMAFLADKYQARPQIAAALQRYVSGSSAGSIGDLLRETARGLENVSADGQLDLLSDLERIIASFEEVHGIRGVAG